MALGGARIGAGRPRGAVSQATQLAMEIKEIMAIELRKKIKPILEAQLDSAKGIQTEHYDAKTNKLFYKEHEPNTFAFKTILEQVAGKPSDVTVITPIQINFDQEREKYE